MSVPNTDSITILRALPSQAGLPRPVLAKRWAPGIDGAPASRGYDSATWFAVEQLQCLNLSWAAEQFARLEMDPHAAMIRGEPTARCYRACTARRCDRAKYGDDVTFETAARRLVMIDADGLASTSTDPAVWIEELIRRLSNPFRTAACWWQASGSAGFRPGARLHAWFYLSRPASDAEVKALLHDAPVDLGLYSPVQFHYTAAPVLIGLDDPLPRRSGWRSGREVVEIPDHIEVPPPRPHVGVELAALSGEMLADDMQAVAVAMRRSGLAAAIWRGERAYPDRSRAHFALGCALARAGLRDPHALYRVMVAFDVKHGRDVTKIMRPDYGARTVGAVLGELVRG